MEKEVKEKMNNVNKVVGCLNVIVWQNKQRNQKLLHTELQKHGVLFSHPNVYENPYRQLANSF